MILIELHCNTLAYAIGFASRIRGLSLTIQINKIDRIGIV